MAKAFKAEAEAKLHSLSVKQEEFGSLGAGARAQLLGELLEALKASQADLPALSDAAVLKMGYKSAEGEDATMPWCLEQLLLVQWVTGFCTRFRANLESVEKTGKCLAPKELRTRHDGRLVADVFPLDGGDSMKPNKDWKCEVWIQPGKDATQGAMITQKPRPGSVGLVLGAGNVGALAVADCLHILFQHNSVVLYKLHPLRTYQEEFVRKLFAPLITKGYFDTIQEQNGVADSQFLVSHPSLCNLHMTGSTETHDAIVWGPKEGRQDRRSKKAAVIDLNKVTVTSELGCITPYFVCPGTWTTEELRHHALQLAVSFTGNNGYYCNSPKVLLLADGWAQKDEFLGILRGILKALPPVAPYYPGSHKRFEGFKAAYKQNIEMIEGPGFGAETEFGAQIPWSLVYNSVDPKNLDASMGEYAFRNEPFCPILCVCTVKGVAGPAEYLESAVAVANRCIWGRLSCSLIIHPETQKMEAAAVDKAIASLEYGAIVINSWSALAYSYDTGVWGAYAGGTPPLERIEEVESGLGFVNNTLAFDHIEKCVVTSPFVDKVNQPGTGPMLTREATGNLVNFLINPGALSLLKMLAPGLFKPPGKIILGALGVAALAMCGKLC